MRWNTTLTPAIIERYTRAGFWQGETLDRRLAAVADRHPDRVAIVDGFSRVTYEQLADEVDRVAAGLHRLGIGPGDVVTLQLPNWRQFSVVHLALTRLGAVTNPVLTQYRQSELLKMAGRANSKAVVTAATYRKHDHAAMWAQLRRELPALQHVIVVDPEGASPGDPDLLPYEALLAGGTEGLPSRLALTGNEVTVLLYTSGTVANKGVMHTHNTMFYGMYVYQRALDLGEQDVVWMPSPISHGTGLQWGVRTAVFLGAKLVLQDQWHAEEACRLIDRERCTVTMGATPFVHDLVEAAARGTWDLSSFRFFVCAGSPIPRELARAAKQEIGCQLLGAYGMSEHFVSTISRPTDPEHLRGGTDGRPVDGTEVGIFDDARQQLLPPGQQGELAVRGPGVAVGYLGDPERTAETFRADGWQFSEDLATMDEQDFVRIVGRKKDMIIRGGLNISPTEVEDLLFDHPDVQRAAAVGMPDPRLGERMCIYVVPRDGRPVTLEGIVQYLSERGLAKYKLPERLEVVERLPTTPSGKVQKIVLRQLITEKLRAEAAVGGERG